MTTPHYTDDAVTLYAGDCLDLMRELPDSSVDAVVTDPPYGLEFMGREWDGADGFRRSLNPEDAGRDSVFGRTSRTSPEYRTKPEGKVSVIGEADGSPHRRNTGTPAWGASGNPACLNCGGTKYDRTRPNGCKCDAPRFPNHMAAQMHTFQEWSQAWTTEALRVLKPGGHLLAFGGSRTWHRLACAVEDAGFEVRDSIAWLLYGSGFPKSRNVGKEVPEFEGWGTALKPAFEPIVVGRKPLAGTVAANVLTHGTGALNIDGCRVGGPDGFGGGRKASSGFVDGYESDGFVASDKGRWPANVVLDEAAAVELDVQSGTLKSGANPTRRGVDGDRTVLGTFAGQEAAEAARGANSGGASRFYYCAKAPARERVKVDGVAHPTVKPLALMRWLVRLVTPPGGTVLEPFAGSGTTAEACVIEGFQCIAFEREPSYLPLIVARLSKDAQTDLFGGAA